MTGGCYHLIYIHVKLVSYVYIYITIYTYTHVIHTLIYTISMIYYIQNISHCIPVPFIFHPHSPQGKKHSAVPRLCGAAQGLPRRTASRAVPLRRGMAEGTCRRPAKTTSPRFWRRIRDGIGAVGINKWDLKMVSEWDSHRIFMGY